MTGITHVPWCRLTHTALENSTEPLVPQYPLSLQHTRLLELGCHRVGLTWGQDDRWGRVALPCVDTSKKRVRPEFQFQLILSLSALAPGVIIWSVLEQRRGEWVRNYHPVCLTTAAGFPLLIYCLCSWGVQREVNES